VDDTLLFLHVLSAFMLMATVVLLSGVAVGANVGSGTVRLANILWDVGGVGTIVFGIWIVARSDFYEIGDGWIIGAIVLWVLMAGLGVRARDRITDGAFAGAGLRLHWLRALIVVGFLVLMVWKPGA
jgi:hypothetical protein